MGKKKTQTNFVCGKCDKGTVLFTKKDNDVCIETFVGRCTNCKYQYGLKELFEAKLKLPTHETN